MMDSFTLRGFDSLQEGDNIYGRDKDIDRIYEGIASYQQTIIYGKSGIGKTSLLQAGIFPRLRQDNMFPVVVRLGPSDAINYSYFLLDKIEEEVRNLGYSTTVVSDYLVEEAPIIWSYLNTHQFTDSEGIIKIPVLILDQFEEVLNNKDTYDRAEELLLNLYMLIDGSSFIPAEYLPYDNFRLVFTIREDYLYYFEDIIEQDSLNEFKDNRYRLKGLDIDGAKSVIFSFLRDRIDPKSESRVCEQIIKNARDSIAWNDINPGILSLLCSRLAENNHIKELTAIQAEDAIYDYYEKAMNEVSAECRCFLERNLVTYDGLRDSVDLKSALHNGYLSEKELHILTQQYKLLRIINSGNDSSRIEFIHDVIAKVVRMRAKDTCESSNYLQALTQNVSHEIRTPLNAIAGFSQLLSLPDGSLSQEEKDDCSKHIIQSIQVLMMLIDDLLSISASGGDSFSYKIVYEENEKNFMAQSALSIVESHLRAGVSMYYAPDDPSDYMINTDGRRVHQILVNLLTNACKNTSAGEIVLTSSLKEHPGYLTYSVADTGIGIAPEYSEKIFERYVKLKDNVQGKGLGLSICREIAELMEGKVYLDTSYTGGARFVFMIPLNTNK